MPPSPKPSCPIGPAAPRPTRPPRVGGAWPIVGHTWQILRRPWGFLNDAYRAHGSAFRISVKGERAVVLAGPEVRDLYSDTGDTQLDRSFFYEPLERELQAKELIFRTTGARHREMRRCASLAFSRHVAVGHLPAAAAEMVRSFESLKPGRPYDTLSLAGDVLLAAVGPMLAACDLRPILRDASEYANTMMQVSARTRLPFALWRPSYRRAKRRSRAFAHDLLRRWRAGAIDTAAIDCVVGCVAEARDGGGDPFPDDDLAAFVLLTFVGAGVYINRVVAFMLYELLRDSQLLDRVTAEVDEACAGGVTYDAICRMPLVRAVYCEALRRYPIWFVVPFRAEQDFVFDGHQIQRGEALLMSSVVEHFLPRFYRDPERFDPARCLPPRNEHQRRGAFAPFGAGVRRCIATGQTEILAMLFVATLLRTLRVRAENGHGLRLRLQPLPAPYRSRLVVLERRPPASTTAASPVARDRLADLDRTSERLALEEEAIFKAVVDREMDVVTFAPGRTVFHQGDPPDAFYVIEAGRVHVIRVDGAGGEERLATLGPGDVFGELGLLRRRPRSASIRVVADAGPLVALKCSADAFERLLGDLNLTGEELIALIQRRKVAAALARLVPAIDRDALLALVPDVTFRRGRRGDVFVREGDPSEALHVIERGTFEVVTVPVPGAERVLARLGPGEFFGEMGLVRQAPRNATVRVAADCDDAETLVVGKAPFLRLLDPAVGFRERLFAVLGERG